MIIDAMDLLYTNRFDGFCIVSSDSDFTRLAARIRETGLYVYGFGEKKTPDAFVSACDKFVYTEVLRAKEGDESVIKKRSTKELRQDTKLTNLLRSALEASSDDDGWSKLGPIGSYIAKKTPDFDPRNYGYEKLGKLMEATELFDIKEKSLGSGRKVLQVKDKRNK